MINNLNILFYLSLLAFFLSIITLIYFPILVPLSLNVQFIIMIMVLTSKKWI